MTCDQASENRSYLHKIHLFILWCIFFILYLIFKFCKLYFKNSKFGQILHLDKTCFLRPGHIYFSFLLAVIIVPFIRITSNGCGSNLVISFEVCFCHNKTMSPTCIVDFFACRLLSPFSFIFALADSSV